MHKFGHWRYLLLNGRIKRGIAHPRRERILVRSALSKLGLRYKEFIPFYNPYWHGYKDTEGKAIQWLDFCIFSEGLLVILFDYKYPNHGFKKPERLAWEVKVRFLEEKGIPTITLPRTLTSQIYEFEIKNFIKKGGRVDE